MINTFAFSLSSFSSSASGFPFLTSFAARAGGEFCFLFMRELIHALAIWPNLPQQVHLVSGLSRQLPALCPSFALLKHLPCRSRGMRCFLSWVCGFRGVFEPDWLSHFLRQSLIVRSPSPWLLFQSMWAGRTCLISLLSSSRLQCIVATRRIKSSCVSSCRSHSSDILISLDMCEENFSPLFGLRWMSSHLYLKIGLDSLKIFSSTSMTLPPLSLMGALAWSWLGKIRVSLAILLSSLDVRDLSRSFISACCCSRMETT